MISHKDVASVEIMENHQPVRALEDVIFSGSPAMNIKLKEDAKSRWAGTVKGGGGIPGLWNAEAFAANFLIDDGNNISLNSSMLVQSQFGL